ncbi:MAG TPA: 2-phosphosulfolactate phosphatase [Bacillota bacterium]|nr:2-phosphosulfolactate phosphatase [Bacillota bacterium]
MKVDVLLYPQALTNQVFLDKKVVVIDAFRATTTIVTALAHQAIEVIPVNEPAEAIALRRSIGVEECIAGGEQKGFKIEGFNLGNSPAEYIPAEIGGKKVILCTTNGTKAIKRAQGAAEVLIGAFVNIQTVIDYLKSANQDVLMVCAGREQNVSMEDLTCAGMIIQGLVAANREMELTDAARVALLIAQQAQPKLTEFLKNTEHGRYLIRIGMENDVEDCTVLNKFPILPRFTDGKVVVG